MTWMRNLYETYERNKHLIGKFQKNKFDEEYTLLPVSHTTQNAHIEVLLDFEGNFLSAKVVDKEDATTIIPCTDDSASRTSSPVPHPLFDKLVYVAGDYEKYGGKIKRGTPHQDYMNQLRSWCESEYGHPKVRCVYNYLKNGTLIEDLINENIIYVDENNKFIEKWDKNVANKYGEKPLLFRVLVANQSDAFVRFSVTITGDPEPRLWRDETVYESFINYYKSLLKSKDLCYVTGKLLPITEKHASRIRNSADKAKLISANDTTGFTYRGRFIDSKDAVTVSYDVSQKAHSALKWLIEKQGFTIDGKVFLVWGKDSLNVPSPYEGTDSLGIYGTNEEIFIGDGTHEEFANQVRKAISGYRNDLRYHSNVYIMILDAATKGRMSIVYYRDIDKELFLDRIENWHKTCYWLHRYKKNKVFIGAPATKDIAHAVLGPKASQKVIKGIVERLLPCIIDNRKIPQDIIRNAINRASNPVSMEIREWEKVLSITCALVRKYYEKEEFDVSLDMENDNRDYLFGRMLAIADVIERRALDQEENRATNAIRYMNAFAQHPVRTWKIIQSSIQPYQVKLGKRLNYLNGLLDEVGSRIKPSDFTDKPLTGLYLLGFYSQRHELYKIKNQKNNGGN